MATLNKAVKPIDDSLRFIQESFNTGDVSFLEIVRQLERYANSPSLQAHFAKEEAKQKREAERLAKELSTITILTDFDKYNKFDQLGNFGLGSSGLVGSYKVADDIIKDIRKARQWLKSYNRYRNSLVTHQNYNLHDDLIKLGKSILGRAIELTPMDTGLLRRSGTLYDFGSYIIIAFTAPYAVYVHENLEIAHPRHADNPDCGGEAKFLEKAVQEFFPDRTVWVEVLGEDTVSVKISINPLLIEYTHYG